ncbi:hypothetical protein A2U01_0031945, partial [Trifolium medium]|nr:hypothetical protein [Trifolium medium]
MKFVGSKSLKYPTKPLLKRKVSTSQSSDVTHFLFSNEPHEVILEFMRAMKDDGIIITRDDIVQVSPIKERKDSSESENDQPASEGKVTTSKDGASEAQVVTVSADTSKRKRAGKDKAEVVVKEKDKRKRVVVSESDKENVTKKQKIQKKKAPRKFVFQEEDEEETDDESLQSKRKKPKPEAKEVNAEANAGNSLSNKDDILSSQAQNQPLSNTDLDPALLQPLNIAYPAQMSDLPPITSETDIDTVIEGMEIASEIHQNK